MASLTPGVLSNLLQTATGKPLSSPPFLSSHHRSPLLQVIEIVPCLSDNNNQWRSDGFFLKVSDSLHAAYVAVSAGDDADLIRSDQIQLGQFVYIRGGLHVDKGCPVPIIRGLKPVPKSRRVCIGNPSDLVSSDLLVSFSHVSVSPMAKKKTMNAVEPRRLSLDSATRSCWDQSPPMTHRRDAALLLSSPHLKPKLVLIDKNLPKNESSLKHLNCESSALRNKNVFKPPSSPMSMAKSPKDRVNLLSKTKTMTPPVASLFKLPSTQRTWSDHRIVWSGLPKTIQLLGKEVSSHRQVAASTAVNALEQASAMESVLLSLKAFGELCDSSKKLCAGQVVRRFLDIYHSTQNTCKAVHLLLTQSPNNGSSRTEANKKATSWIQTAVLTGFSHFNLFKEPEIIDDAAPRQENHHYIVIQNSPENLNPKETTSPRNPAYKCVKTPSAMKHRSVSERSNIEGKSGLKELACLAEELVRVSSQWFLKYLESSLNKGFSTIKKDAGNGKESLLVNLKALNRWLDDVILTRTESSERVEDLRKKLQQFLLEHIETAMGGTRSSFDG